MAQEFNVLALIKGQERFIFVYDDDSRQQLIDTFRDQAADPSLSLNWFDAMVLTTKAREQADQESEVSVQKSEVRNQESDVSNGVSDEDDQTQYKPRFSDR